MAPLYPNNCDETTILGGRVRLVQPLQGLRAGLDAVMLAAACPAKAGEHIADIGCAAGAAGFCVQARVADVRLTGLDIQALLIGCAKASAALNGGFSDFVAGDVRDKAVLPADGFDHVICNPPYMQEGAWSESVDPVRQKQMGKIEGDASLQDWIDCLQRIAKPKGSITVIHRADHVDKLMQAMGARFGGYEIFPLFSKAGEAANRVIVRARKNMKSPATIHAGLVLHEADGRWTEAANAILRDAIAI